MNILNGIGILFLYLVIFISIFIYILLIRNKQNIIDNWPIYRCEPYIIPLASVFGKDPGENLSGCMYQSTQGFFGVLIKPFYMILTLFTNILKDLFDHLDILRNFLEPIRNFIAFGSDMVYKKVEGIMNVVIYSFLKINNLLKRVFANFRLAVYSLEASQMAINSTWDGPIGGLVRQWGPMVDFFCFAKGTNVNGIPIENIQISNNVIGILTFEAPKYLYNYKGIYVSGNHFVKHNDQWMMVKETDAQLIPNNISKTLHSLITKNHRICFSGIEWADYEETDRLYRIQKQLALKNLESDAKTEFLENEPNLLLANTPILLKNMTWSNISDIKLGDILFPNNKVVGLIKVQEVINHNSGVGRSNIIFENKAWSLMNNVEYTKSFGVHYNLITTKGYFITKKYIVRDYLEVDRMDLYGKLSDITHLVLDK